ncbi:MAG: hypothetical protein BRC27_00650 [Nanohaloarchaea archaeon SW_10_44_10]|nr:MAG: hypothetical protein BRC27_00650 [Nanohaloarchaea archaeon SW_10_44_10]
MDLKQRISELDNRVKIASVLTLVLVVGFLASSAPGLQEYSGQQKLSQSASSDLAYDAPTTTEAGGGGDTRESADSSSSERKVVTTVRTTLKVSDVGSAINSVTFSANSLGGFIESSSVNQDRESRGRITVAVPEENLSKFESDLESNWQIKSRNVNRDDVTDSYNKLETEINSLKAEHQRLQELINQTDDVENLIRLQERMSEVRSQINYKQQRLDRLKEDIQYSKVHLTLEGPQSFESRFEIRETLSEAYGAVFESVKLIILGVAYLLPVAALYGIYRLARLIKERRL